MADPYNHPSISDTDLLLIKNKISKITPHIVTNVKIDFDYFVKISSHSLNSQDANSFHSGFLLFSDINRTTDIIDIISRCISPHWNGKRGQPICRQFLNQPFTIKDSLGEFEKRNNLQQKIMHSIISDTQYILPTTESTLLLTLQQKQKIVELSKLLMNIADEDTSIDILYEYMFHNNKYLKNFNGIITELDLYDLLFGENKNAVLKKYECILFDIFSIFEAFQFNVVDTLKKDLFKYLKKIMKCSFSHWINIFLFAMTICVNKILRIF